MPSKLSQPQLKYLKRRFDDNVNFIIQFRPLLFIFNGNVWHTLLIKNNLVIKYDKVSISEKFSRTEKRLQDIEKYAYAYSSGYDEKLPDLLSTNEENNEEYIQQQNKNLMPS